MHKIVDKRSISSAKDSRQAIPETTFGLVALNHFGISVEDLDRSIAFYRALTGQEPVATGNWSSIGLDGADWDRRRHQEGTDSLGHIPYQ